MNPEPPVTKTVATGGILSLWPVAGGRWPAALGSRHPPPAPLDAAAMATTPRAMTAAERWYREKFAQTPERDALFTTISGERIEPLYTHEDLPDAERIGFPGEFPYTRGVYPSMFRGRLCAMGQFRGFGTGDEPHQPFR